MPFDRRSFLKAMGACALGSSTMGQRAGASIGTSEILGEEFDFVVVGSGAGGGVVATRLVEAGFSVAVIEAGDAHENDNYRVPAFHLKSSADPTFNWNFPVQHYSEKSQHGKRYMHQQGGMLYPRAATLGGCTAHHAMLVLLPHARDWQLMADSCRDKSWSPLLMERYFDRVKEWLPVEKTSPALLMKDHTLSRVVTAAALETNPAQRLMKMLPNLNPGHVDALRQFSLDPNSDGDLEGLFMVPQSTDNGKRYGTRERLLDVQRKYPRRLKIFINTLVSKVLLDENDSAGERRALGVEVIQRDHLYQADPLWRAIEQATIPELKKTIRARREVILSGGAFNSPQLLQLSGIGPASLLRRNAITPKVDLPGVGENLQDRYEVAVVTEFSKKHDILADCTFGGPDDPCMAEYDGGGANRTYSTNGLLVGIKKRSAQSTHPDLFVFGSPSEFEGYEPGFADKAVASGRAFTWAVLKGYTSNTSGSVRIRSASPFQTPNINFRYFDDGRGGETDLAAVREGIALARKINQRARGLQWLDGRQDQETVPGPAMTSKAALNEHIRREAWGHHASCSNKMGADDDPMAVVNSECKVRGTSNLRVIDASVFPRIPGLFIVLPLYILAEKAVADILHSHGSA